MQAPTYLVFLFILFVSTANASKKDEGSSSTSFKDVEKARQRVRDTAVAEDAHRRRTNQQPPASSFSQHAFDQARKALEHQHNKARDDSKKATDQYFGKQ